MNKAFTREPDPVGEFCPRCESLGQSVQRATIEAHLKPGEELSLANPANFCPSSKCEVAYFDLFERYVLVSQLNEPVYPKDPDAPICACFGLTEDDIEIDLAEGKPTRVKALLAKAQSSEAQCAKRAANGRSCVADVQRYYIRRREEANRGE